MDIDPSRRTQYQERFRRGERMPGMSDFESLDEAKEFVNWCLEGGYDDFGIESWWHRPRQQLGGRTPEAVWPESAEQVMELAIRLCL